MNDNIKTYTTTASSGVQHGVQHVLNSVSSGSASLKTEKS